jgi:hypothetical protein
MSEQVLRMIDSGRKGVVALHFLLRNRGKKGATTYGPTITIFATEGVPDPLIKKSM